jgi:hypothetical protein
MPIVRYLAKLVRSWFKRAKSSVVPAPIVHTVRVFLVRTGEDDYPISRSLNGRALSYIGELQAHHAGGLIREALGGEQAAVFTHPDDPMAYRQTARAIAEELGVPLTMSSLRPPPGTHDLMHYVRLGSPVVMVVNGSHLAAELRENPGPLVELGLLGPSYGSVHELVIKFQIATFGFPEEISRVFV